MVVLTIPVLLVQMVMLQLKPEMIRIGDESDDVAVRT